MRPLSVKPTSVDAATKVASESVVNHRVPLHSIWHSPVPYLFGGLAAVLGLIAVALIILACSYWRYSTRAGTGDGGEEEKDSRSGVKSTNTAYEEKVLVIMAGEDLPTFLATPVKKCVCHEAKMKILEDGSGGETTEEDGEKVVKEHEEASR